LVNKHHPETLNPPRSTAYIDLPSDAQVVQALEGLCNELANAQRDLARRNIELGRAIHEKNQLLGMAVHDLRNPLGIIIGVVDLLRDELTAALSEENRNLFSHVASSAEYMVQIIDDLLDYSKIEAGQLELRLQPIELAGLIQEALAFNSILANKKGIQLRFVNESSPLLLDLDSRRLRQVFDNLISNALKFSHSDTTVTVTLYCGVGEITIAVADEGQGIAADELGKLFMPYSRTRTTSTANEHSTGLGLAIVRRIVETHSGRIWVESELGRGSIFYVSLPAISSTRG
jgi:signal transduction histidine kinase